ncbi:hypothetical protein MMAGJ_54640 [Mycolicibacterium mageritense]|uniref:Uncharacterized protein n=1 Tax=Mycolicibacterium mageritense TaxID=53462 RepID=A0ABM7HZY3_MYCME|nr:hypothetical protein MMAGJ_54640 [Mycolicibacterium mageritense]
MIRYSNTMSPAPAAASAISTTVAATTAERAAIPQCPGIIPSVWAGMFPSTSAGSATAHKLRIPAGQGASQRPLIGALKPSGAS